MDDVEALHTLATDAHVRHFLLDGATVPASWASHVVEVARARARTDGLGLWFVQGTESDGVPWGFCGFWEFEDLGPEPQLIYALKKEHTNQGFATEMGRACIELARSIGSLKEITAAVDSPNVASIRVLEKLGFEVTRTLPGPFGHTLMFQLRA